jgi:uncharacterized membrane protein
MTSTFDAGPAGGYDRGNGVRCHAQEVTVTTPFFSIVCFVIAALLGAVGQLLYKSGVEHAGQEWSGYVLNFRILGGVVCYVAVMVLFLAAFRKGGSLSVLYPIYASTFIFAALLDLGVYSTPIRLVNIAGMALLVIGMYLMGHA